LGNRAVIADLLDHVARRLRAGLPRTAPITEDDR
jgi:hypothetical protein